jgi:N-acetylneuraminic acid mutarotase
MSGSWTWKTCSLFVSGLMVTLIMGCSETDMEKPEFYLRNIPPMPPSSGDSIQRGVAGPVTGSQGDYLLVAGGANFRNGLPWKGGIKEYHDDIYLLRQNALHSYSWEISSLKLPLNLAYPACVNTPGGVLSIGGENETGPLKQVFLISFSDGKVLLKTLPGLPEPVSAAGAALIGSKVYLAGGMNSEGASASFRCLDLKAPETGWVKLPDLPFPVSHAVVVAQQDSTRPCIFLIGGRNKTGDWSDFFSSNWKYDPESGKWMREPDIRENGKPVPLSAGTGIAVGKNSIVLFGGDRGMIFNQTEKLNARIGNCADPVERQALLDKKDSRSQTIPDLAVK